MRPRSAAYSLLTAAAVALTLLVSPGPAAGGDLFSTKTVTGNVVQYAPNGIHRIPFTSAYGLTFYSAGNLYVTDYGASVIYEVGPNGKRKVITSGKLINNPAALAFDSSNNLFVIHDGSHPGIAKITPDGTISSFAEALAGSGLAFDSAGNLFATDYLTNAVLKFSPDGVRTTFATGFGQPDDVAFDSNDNLFVSDSVSGIIYKITADGSKSTFATGLTEPLGLAFDSADNLFVAAPPFIFEFAPDGAQTTFIRNPSNDLAFQP